MTYPSFAPPVTIIPKLYITCQTGAKFKKMRRIQGQVSIPYYSRTNVPLDALRRKIYSIQDNFRIKASSGTFERQLGSYYVCYFYVGKSVFFVKKNQNPINY